MKLRTGLILSSLALVLALGPLGCHRKPKRLTVGDRTAATLLASGQDALKQGKWADGRKLLRLLEENMPSSPEYAQAKLLIGDSFFFAKDPSYPEAAVEYQNFLSFFPRHEMRDYALYHIALCHFGTIENAERDQAETRLALEAFQNLLKEAPTSPYALDAQAKITQCWRRIAESELMVGIFYVKSRHYAGAETRLKGLLEAYPEYADRERAYYYLGLALGQKMVGPAQTDQFRRDYLARIGKEPHAKLANDEEKLYKAELATFKKGELARYRQEARDDFKRLIESYPKSPWTKRAQHDLQELEKRKDEADEKA